LDIDSDDDDDDDNVIIRDENSGNNDIKTLNITQTNNDSCSAGIDESTNSKASKGNIITTISELEHDEHEGMDAVALLEHEEITKIKNVNYVQFGKYKIECWYFSPFSEEVFSNSPIPGIIDCLYFCEFTMRFFKTQSELLRYQKKSGLHRYPPGNEIYRDTNYNLSMFEIDGSVEKIYCQNLCYFAKLFLDHKTLYWDVDPFLFYVLCTFDSYGFHPVGFFSKEK
jgi:histone acetyltransferase MYST1